MKVVVHYKSNFLEWPNAVIRKMQQTVPDIAVVAIATDSRIYQQLKACNDMPFEAIYDLQQLERGWIKAPADYDLLAETEEKFGVETLLKTMIADKCLGRGWVTGATLFETEIAKQIRDKDRLVAYMTGLFQGLGAIYEKHQPDWTFMHAIAGGLTYAVAAVSKHYGCPFYRFAHSRIGDYYIADGSVEGIQDRLKEVLLQAGKKPELLRPYQKEARAYLAQLKTQHAAPSCAAWVGNFMRQSTNWRTLLRTTLGVLFRSCKKFIHSEQAYPLRQKPERQIFFYGVTSRLKRRFFNYSRYFSSLEAVKKDYVFFPLHVDPEASTLVTAPYYTDQLFILEQISKKLPLSSQLVVKEHPAMIGQRPVSFYKSIQAMPNVTLVDTGVGTQDLIKKASLVVTITGTAGWEALVMKKPLLVLGETPYMHIGAGFVKWDGRIDLSEAMKKAIKTPPASDEILISYIAAAIKIGVKIPDAIMWRFTPALLTKHKDIIDTLASYLLRVTNGETMIENRKKVNDKAGS